MKIIIPSKRVEAPMLSEEQISKLIDGRYVEGAFGLDEGDVFTIRYGGERFEAFCYRMIDPGRCRIRRKGRGQKAYTYSETSSKPLLPLYDVLPVGNMAEMKCPSCGGTDFVRYPVDNGFNDDMRPIVSFDTFVCLACGRVEQYVGPDTLSHLIRRKENVLKAEKELTEIDRRMFKCRIEMARLEKAVAEGDKSAEERMTELEKQIGVAKDERIAILLDYDPNEG